MPAVKGPAFDADYAQIKACFEAVAVICPTKPLAEGA
jgi:hypothetical protein